MPKRKKKTKKRKRLSMSQQIHDLQLREITITLNGCRSIRYAIADLFGRDIDSRFFDREGVARRVGMQMHLAWRMLEDEGIAVYKMTNGGGRIIGVTLDRLVDGAQSGEWVRLQKRAGKMANELQRQLTLKFPDRQLPARSLLSLPLAE